MATRYELEEQIDSLLNQEIGTIYGDAPIRIALVYPSPYRVGMSSLGFQTIYRTLNSRDDVVCERAFLPDDPQAWHDARMPLVSFESKRRIDEFDIVAFSVAYEVEILGLLECLDLAGIPFRHADRKGGGWPFILFGGPLTNSNPLPVAPFCDAMVMGEGEELVHLTVNWWREAKDRARLLEDLAVVPGFYVPSIHGEVLRPLAQARNESLPAYSQIVTPNTELSNMHLVENARGCHRGCSFCVMRRTTNGGMRPVPAEQVLATIPDHAKRVGLVGAATSDHPEIIEIMQAIVGAGREVGLSSLRADRMTEQFVGLLAEGGARSLTVASDGSSARIRKIAMKNIRDEHLVKCAELVRDVGMKHLKLYMVIGYPEETMDDIDEMVEFVGRLNEICPVALGMSPLVAKKNTPLDAVPFEQPKSLEAKIKRVHDGLGRHVDIRSTSVRWAWIEYQLAQGGWDMADAAEAAYEGGGSFGAWKRAFKKHAKKPAPIQKPESNRLTPGAMLPDELFPHDAFDDSEIRPTGGVDPDLGSMTQ